MNKAQEIEKWCKVIQSLNDDGIELIETVLRPFFDGTDQYTTIDPDKLEHYHEYGEKVNKMLREREQQREQPDKERSEFESVFVYNRNPTMHMIGRQSVGELLAETEMREQFEDVRDAHRYNFIYEIAIDFFVLGVICGKRIERKRRRGKARQKHRKTEF